MNLGWYLARLKNMSAAELLHRVTEKNKKLLAKNRLEGWSRYEVGSPTVPAIPGLAQALRAGETPPARGQIENCARKIMGGQFSALGQEWPRFSFEDDARAVWNLDPVTGGSWPSDIYCFEVGYRGATGIGDVKYVWEFQRLQFLQPVAAHAFLTQDAKALDFIEQAVNSWFEASPPFRGVGWSSGIELALRAISLLVVTSLVGEQLSPTVQRRICTILHAHAFWLERYPSRFSSANNHLVSEVAALFLIGLSCNFLPKRWKHDLVGEAGKALVREASLQILPDGVAAEQSPTYGALTAELLLLCAFAARAGNTPLDASLEARLAAFSAHINWLADAKGNVPAIGDNDEGRVITLAQHETRYPASVAAAIAGVLGRDDLALPFDLDLRNVIMPTTGTAPRPSGARSFVQGGFTVDRRQVAERSTILVVDHAPLGYLSIAAHGHADALSFTLSVDDRPVIVDPGTYLYHSGKKWRDWFRGTRAHNTLTLGGVDQSKIAGAFNWSSKAQARLESFKAEPFRLTASHNGYVRPFGVLHRRQMAWDNDCLHLTDFLAAQDGKQANHVAELVFQLAADCTTLSHDADVTVLIQNEPMLRITLPDGNFTIGQGGDMDGGWVSPGFGQKIPAPRLSWRGEVGQSGVTTTIEILRARS